MRTLLVALAISLASPAPLCMALCGVAFAEQASGVDSVEQAQGHEMPCHEPASQSEPAEACEKCGDAPSFVPAKVADAPMSWDFEVAHTFVAHFESIDRAPTGWRFVEPPDILNSPYARTNPPLLN